MNRRILSILFLSTLLAASASAAVQVLFDFTQPGATNNMAAHDVAVTCRPDSGGLWVTTRHHEPWPGITLPAPGGIWNLAQASAVAVELTNAADREVTVYCRVDNAGADGVKHCLTESLRMLPGHGGTLRVFLRRDDGDTRGGKLFGMRGYPPGPNPSGDFDPARVTQLIVFVNRPTRDHTFAIRQIRAVGGRAETTGPILDDAHFFPFIDSLGQYRHRDWPGKTTSPAELAVARAAEAEALARHPGPTNWDKYGGAQDGPQLAATGFFRTQKVGSKWWLVDPDGHLFFSQGIDCVRMLDYTPVAERTNWFADSPGVAPEFREFCDSGFALLGHYQEQTVAAFSFAGANLKRKYGSDWRQVTATVFQQRLRSWGFNTIGNWSDFDVARLRRTPYTDTIGAGGAAMLQGSEGYWGKFPDVFAPGFAAALERDMAGKKERSANDPWCLGYFSDNEMSWGDDTSLALATLRSPADQPAKLVFVAELRAKYGAIARLNSAWGVTNASWEALLATTNPPDAGAARADLTAFYTKTAETYFRTVRDATRTVAPHQLYLGCRFAAVNDLAAQAAAKYCDVVSYNLYQRSVADFQFPGGDKPLLIGEFHFGALDRGLFHPGLVPVSDQAARARAYQDYMLGALRHPQFVGAHWFQWQDEPATGRVYDGENYQIGFVDVADTPYPEMIAASRAVAAELYRNLPEK